MKQLQMGLEGRIETTLEPWLCYYCGQCSEQCPRDADPGETMMSLRRWLITKYDFTGIARQFFKSKTTEILIIVAIGLLSGAFLLLWGFSFGNIHIYDGQGAFLPSSFIHRYDLIIGGAMLFFLLANAIRMWYYSMFKGVSYPVPWWLYIKEIFELPIHFFTQKRYAECESNGQQKVYMPWIIHLGLMLGYVTMLLLVMIWIEPLQAGPEIRWSVHIFGYLATISLVAGTVYFIWHRAIKKNYAQYKKSHGTDWVFIVLLFFIVLTGIFQHILHRTGMYAAANIIYVIHLMVVTPWLLRMPFTKWAHLVYRPLAMYFAAIKLAAFSRQTNLIDSLSVSFK